MRNAVLAALASSALLFLTACGGDANKGSGDADKGGNTEASPNGGTEKSGGTEAAMKTVTLQVSGMT